MKKRMLIQSLVLMLLGAGLCAQADAVTDWNKAALDAIRADRTPPPRASRNLAILHASIYDAVNGISRTYEAYFVESAVPASASPPAAASAAAHAVLISLYPADSADFDDLHAATLGAIPDGPQKDMGVKCGEAVAEKILAWCAGDGSDATVLALFYGTDTISFTTGSDFLPGVFRSFSSLSAAASEAAGSRVYGGIHFRFASDDGLAAGLRIGERTFTRYLQPKDNFSRK